MAEYIIEGDWTVCTCGTRQAGIKVVSHNLTMRSNQKKIATDVDKMESSYICLKIASNASVFGTITGASAGCALSGLGGIAGVIGGAAYGAAKGGELGSELGGKAGKTVGGWLGKTIGAGAGSVAGFFTGIGGAIDGAVKGFSEGEGVLGTIGSTLEGAAKGGVKSYANTVETASDIGEKGGEVAGDAVGSVVGGTAGGIVGGTTGAAVGGTIGTLAMPVVGGLVGSIAGGASVSSLMASPSSMPTGILLIDILPHICMMLTASKWINCHSNVIISKHHALLLESKLTCSMGGLVTIIKIDWIMATDCAKICKYMYCDPNEDTDDNDAVTDENKKGLETFDTFTQYNPENLGWNEVTPEALVDKGILKEDKNGYYLADNDKIRYTKEMYKGDNECRYYFTDSRYVDVEHDDRERYPNYNNGSGLKVGLYEKDGHYILASRGTHRNEDWVDDNFTQEAGFESEQYNQTIILDNAVSEGLGADNVTFTGHSLAGGTQSGGGVVTGCQTYVFNPAGLNKKTVEGYDLNNASNVTTFRSDSDPLNNLQNNFLPKFLPHSVGNRIEIKIDNNFSLSESIEALKNGQIPPYIVAGHDLPALIQVLEEKAKTQGSKLITTTR